MNFASQNSNSTKTRVWKKSEKLAILEPKLEIFEQKSSLLYVQTWHLKLDEIQTWSSSLALVPTTVWRGNEWLLYDIS